MYSFDTMWGIMIILMSKRIIGRTFIYKINGLT